jgi:hypothetical protein
MKFSILFLAAAASAAVTRRVAPSAVAPQIQSIPATIRADAVAKKIRYGPYTMDAASVSSAENGILEI